MGFILHVTDFQMSSSELAKIGYQNNNPNNVHSIIVAIIEAETNGRHFSDDIFKCIFLNENVFISIKISLKFVPKGQINNIPALV